MISLSFRLFALPFLSLIDSVCTEVFSFALSGTASHHQPILPRCRLRAWKGRSPLRHLHHPFSSFPFRPSRRSWWPRRPFLSLSLCHSVSGHASCTAVDGADHLPAVPCHAGLPDRGPVSALPYVYRRHTGAAVQRDVRLLPLHFNSAPEYEPRDVPAVPDGHVHPRQHPRGSCGASGTSKAMRLHRPTTHRRCIRR